MQIYTIYKDSGADIKYELYTCQNRYMYYRNSVDPDKTARTDNLKWIFTICHFEFW